MNFLICSLVILMTSAIFSFFCRGERSKKLFALGGTIVGSVLGLIPAFLVLSHHIPLAASFESTIPGLVFDIGLDSLSAFFLIPILGLSALVALYAWGYLKGQKRLLDSLPFFPLLVASMMGVIIARNGFLFLMIWEIMSLSSFFLVTAEHEQSEVRHAGWIYLSATHLATAFLLVFFVLLYQETGSFSFSDFKLFTKSPLTAPLFIFALIGFGTKAGIFPFHIWLPHAHPAAPSYISALMSGVMIKTGIYGIFRTLTFLPDPPLWCGGMLLFLGSLSAVLGVLYAVMQHDIKRLLAYHSVENIGIIVAGIGLGLIGRGEEKPFLEFLGFGGALFHVLNHAIFKGLLFLGAGNILQATHIRHIDQLGGLLRTMPLTAATFLAASAAICGLPPLNGFISEWLLYLGLFEGAKNLSGSPFFFSVASLVMIAFAGGLAVLCFTKVFGVVFLGHPRREWEQPPDAISDQEKWRVKWHQYLPMGILAVLCFVLGIMPQLALSPLTAVLSELSDHQGSALFFPNAQSILFTLGRMSFSFALLIALFFAGWLLRSWLFSSKTIAHAPTWDCGLDKPTPRMQYTASSYAQPMGAVFHFLLKPTLHFQKGEGIFPKSATFQTHLEDLSERLIFGPIGQKIEKILAWFRSQQRSQAQNYLAYIFVILLVLLLWEVSVGI